MGEHRTNPTALGAQTMPTWPPPNRGVGLRIQTAVVEKPHVFITKPGEAPNAVDMATHAEWCKQRGITQELHELGRPLPPEKCDVVFFYACVYGNTAEKRAGAFTVPGEILRFDMQSLIKAGDESLGEAPRIVVTK